MSEQHKVLIVDPVGNIASQLAEVLQEAGYQPIVQGNLREAVRAFKEHDARAVFLLETLPSNESWEVAQRVREISQAPIIFIADRRDLFAMERALHIGDDYVTPPYNWPRLVVKLGALLRRSREEAPGGLAYDDGELAVDFATRTVHKRGQPIHLTETEFKLLSCFVRRPNRVLSYDELLTQVWGHTHFGAKSHVSLYVRYLRRKLEDDPANPTYFTTEWGVGYSFRPRANQPV